MRDYLKLHLVVLAWGVTAILGKLIQLPAVEVVVLRTAIAILGLWALAHVLGVGVRIGRAAALRLVATGFLIGLHWIFFFWAGKASTASIGLAGMPTAILWCALVEPMVVKSKKLHWYELAIGALMTWALWLILQYEFRYVAGLVLSLTAAFIGSVFAVLNGQLAKRHHFTVISFYEMIGGLTVSLIVLPFCRDIKMPTAADIGWLLVLALGCTVYAYAAYVELLRRLSVFTINIAYNLEPVYGMALAAIFFGEAHDLSRGFYLGVSIIVASVMAVPFLQRWEKSRAAPG